MKTLTIAAVMLALFATTAANAQARRPHDDQKQKSDQKPKVDEKAYKAALDGKSEVPPTTSSGTGTASVTYDSSTKMVTWQGSFSGLSGPATAAHIHGPAEAGKNAGVIVPLSQKDVPFTSPFTGSATLADDKAAALEAALSSGQAYVNVHTAANPGGEVRGQLGKA